MERLPEKYKLVLGLEIHMQPKTINKMFCRCSADVWKAEPNTHTCPTCLGLPGGLPVPNFEAVRKTQILGISVNCTINNNSRFDRKHYFYPDLPKGYQISQYKQPLCENGKLVLESLREADIERIHLEEDTAKSFHEEGKTLIDYNKSGIPLIEIVTRPCFTNIEDAVDFSKKLQNIARYLGLSDADMEKGQLRIEPNISLSTPEQRVKGELPSYKVEVKNINSFKFMEKAIIAEVKRQVDLLEKGETPLQENRGYDEATGKTVPQRSKEEAHDYRYFPEPDIPPMFFDDGYIEKLRAEIPELPSQIRERFIRDYGIDENTAATLVEKMGPDFVRKVDTLAKETINIVKAVNLLVNRREYQDLSVSEFIKRFEEENQNYDIDLTPVVGEILKNNSNAAEDYRKGKESALQFLIGMVMRETKGRAAAANVRDELLRQLEE